MSITVNPALAAATAKRRHLKFVAPTTKSVAYQVTGLVNGVSQTSGVIVQNIEIDPSTPTCTSSGTAITCTTAIPAPVGTDSISVKTYDAFGAPAGATLLGQATSTVTIVANTANTPAPLVVNGVTANIDLFLAQPNVAVATAGQSLLVVVPLDSSGNQIIEPGSYDQPITLTFGSANPHVTFTKGSAGGLSTTTVTSPADQIYVKYDGLGTAGSVNVIASTTESPNGTPVNISASTPFTIGAAVTAAPVLGGSYAQSAGFVFSGIGQSGTITYSGSGTLTATIPGTGSGVASASVNGATVSVVSAGYGSTSVAVTQNGSTITYPISVVAPQIQPSYACTSLVTQCSGAGIIFPTIGSDAGQSATITLTGGTGTYTLVYASGASTNSGGVASATISGSTVTIAPLANGTDVLEIQSGNQTLYLLITVADETITPTAHAYYDAPSSTLTMDTSDGTALLTVQNGSTVTPGGMCMQALPIALTVTQQPQSANYVIAAGSNATACTLTLTPAGGAPFSINVVIVTPISVANQQVSFDALGETQNISFTGGSGFYTAAGSNSSIVTVGAPTAPVGSTPGTVPLAVPAPGASTAPVTGSSAVTLSDTRLGDSVGVSVVQNNAFAQTLSPVGFNDNDNSGSVNAQNLTISDNGGNVVGITCGPGSCGEFANLPFPDSGGVFTVALNPGTSGTGQLQFNKLGGGYAIVPFTVMAFAYNTVQTAVGGASADESFGATGVTDTVTVSNLSDPSNFKVASGDTGVVTASVGGSGSISLTSVAAGQTKVTVTDGVNGAAATFSVSVTTTTIPVSGHGRKPL